MSLPLVHVDPLALCDHNLIEFTVQTLLALWPPKVDSDPRSFPTNEMLYERDLRLYLRIVLLRTGTTTSTLYTAIGYLKALQSSIVEEHIYHYMFQVYMSLADTNDSPTHIYDVPPSSEQTPEINHEGQVLLNPCRTLLVTLMLAWKMVQDQTYNNRSWGTMASIPPRDLTHDELFIARTLGWRLWVGGPSN